MPSKHALRQQNRDLQAALDRSNNYLREADLRGIDQRFLDMQTAVTAALLAADRATGKADTANERRFDSVNEFRQTLSDQASHLMPRAEFQVQQDAVENRVSRLERGERESHGIGVGSTNVRETIRANLTLIVSLIAVAAYLIGQHLK